MTCLYIFFFFKKERFSPFRQHTLFDHMNSVLQGFVLFFTGELGAVLENAKLNAWLYKVK